MGFVFTLKFYKDLLTIFLRTSSNFAMSKISLYMCSYWTSFTVVHCTWTLRLLPQKKTLQKVHTWSFNLVKNKSHNNTSKTFKFLQLCEPMICEPVSCRTVALWKKKLWQTRELKGLSHFFFRRASCSSAAMSLTAFQKHKPLARNVKKVYIK